MYINYEKPISADTLPVLEKSLIKAENRFKRLSLASRICGFVCFLVHTPLMLLSFVGFYRGFSGNWAVVRAELPWLEQLLRLVFDTLPVRLGLSLSMPQLLALAVAVLLPALLCIPLSVLIRLIYRPVQKEPGAEPAALRVLCTELKGKYGLGPKAGWAMLSAAVSGLATVALVAFILFSTNSLSGDFDSKYILSHIFLALVIIVLYHIFATLTDLITSLLCGLNDKFQPGQLIEDLDAIVKE